MTVDISTRRPKETEPDDVRTSLLETRPDSLHKNTTPFPFQTPRKSVNLSRSPA